MKIIDELQWCKGFAICKGAMSADEVYQYSSSNTSTKGVFSQLLFGVSGYGEVYDENNNLKMIIDTPAKIYDLREFYQKSYSIRAGNTGGVWVCINPSPANKFYTAKTLYSNQNEVIVGTDKEQVVLCIDGYIKINNQTLGQFQYSRILKGVEANVSVSSNSVGMYFYTT